MLKPRFLPPSPSAALPCAHSAELARARPRPPLTVDAVITSGTVYFNLTVNGFLPSNSQDDLCNDQECPFAVGHHTVRRAGLRVARRAEGTAAAGPMVSPRVLATGTQAGPAIPLQPRPLPVPWSPRTCRTSV